MDDIRESFSEFKKGIKHRLTGRKRKGDQTGTGGRAEGSETSGSVPQPEAGVITGGGHEQEGDGASANIERVEQGGERIRLEGHGVRLRKIPPPRGERLDGRFRSTQVGCRRPLLFPGRRTNRQ